MADKNLSNRQRKAIGALLSSRNITEAAKVAQVSERTLFRWLADENFRQVLLTAESGLIDAATRRLIGLQEAAIETIFIILKDEQSGPAVRLRAAQSVLDHVLKLRELRDIESRIAHIEEVIRNETQ
jgi:uncharacterized protein YaaQ